MSFVWRLLSTGDQFEYFLKMDVLKVIVFVFASLLACKYVPASIFGYGGCPPANRVYNDKPRCFSDADCRKWGKVCCPNQYNTKSCVDRAPWSNQAYGHKYKYSGGGGGVYCDGVKCRPYEVCKPHPITKRLMCQRP